MSSDTVSIDALSHEAQDANAADTFLVDIDGFEGPLHLLLELARRQKVDLRHIAILPLAEQYLEFIQTAESQRIDLAADYLLMASWLAFMKSRLMLPKPEAAEKDEPTGDEMAARLAFRLKRLEAMREAGEALQSGPIEGNIVFLRGAPEQPKVVKTTEYNTTMWHMMQAFGSIRSRKQQDAPHRLVQQYVLPLEHARQSLRAVAPGLTEWSTLAAVRAQLGDPGEGIPGRSVTASVFTATLELARDGDIDVRQDMHFGPLYLRGMAKAQEGENQHGFA